VTVDPGPLQDALARTGQAHGPGLFGLVTEDGSLVFAGSVGVADLRDARPIGAADMFRIGSITKTYVAALVLRLAADGVIALDDPVERWLPGVVPDGAAVTVELLLSMRSGLPDYTGPVLGDPPDLRALQRYWAPEELVRLALTVPDRIAPGTAVRYCNTDYVLLGLIVERATGQRVDAVLWQRVLEPLGLTDTLLPTVDPYLRGPHATGYLRESATGPYLECTTMSPSEGWTAGGIVATAADLARFLDGLFGGVLLDPDSLALMTAPVEVMDDWRAHGIGILRYDFGSGRVAFGQQGGVPGYTTVALRTTTGRCVVLVQNCIDLHDPLPGRAEFVVAAATA
jgi:D-alanyl-D-alanine carboxypeptidase